MSNFRNFNEKKRIQILGTSVMERYCVTNYSEFRSIRSGSLDCKIKVASSLRKMRVIRDQRGVPISGTLVLYCCGGIIS